MVYVSCLYTCQFCTDVHQKPLPCLQMIPMIEMVPFQKKLLKWNQMNITIQESQWKLLVTKNEISPELIHKASRTGPAKGIVM